MKALENWWMILISPASASIRPYGDAAIFVEFSETFNEVSWRFTHALDLAIRDGRIDPNKIISTMPTYTSIVIHFNLNVTNIYEMKEEIAHLIQHLDTGLANTKSYKYRIPVLYGGEKGPDLSNVAEMLKMTEEEVVNLHVSKASRVVCFSSPAGQPLMNQSSLPNTFSRLSVPRTHIPKGSVAIIGDQTTIYVLGGPGGWQIVGRTPLLLTVPSKMPPSPIRPGDFIEFFPIQSSEWEDYINKNLNEMRVDKHDSNI